MQQKYFGAYARSSARKKQGWTVLWMIGAVGFFAACNNEADNKDMDSDSNSENDSGHLGGIGQEGCVLHCEVNLGILDTLPENLCEAYAVAVSEYEDNCGLSDMLGVVDKQDYISLTTGFCENTHLLEGLPGQPVWDNTMVDIARECLLGMVNAPCGCPSPCADLVLPAADDGLADGEPCFHSTQCQDGYCSSVTLWGCGVCAQLWEGAPQGEVCQYDGDCGEDLYCDVNSQVCTPLKELCETCVADNECGYTNACVGGECAYPYLEAGADCETSRRGCAAGLECRDTGENGAWICDTPYYGYSSVGEGCNVDIVDPIPGRLTCDFFSYCSADENGICLAYLDLGDPCTVDDVGDSDCNLLYVCKAGFCAYPDTTCE